MNEIEGIEAFTGCNGEKKNILNSKKKEEKNLEATFTLDQLNE